MATTPPTPAEDAATEYANWQRKLTELSANPRPSYTLPNGASVKFEDFYRMCKEMRDAARKAMVEAQGPFEANSVLR
jgi:hypothetical protein